MGLSASLTIGRSALTASQIAIQVTGNNFANASTPGYSRQVVQFGAYPDQNYGRYFLGRGVEITGINRQVDTGLLARLNSATSDENAANVDQNLLSSVESTINGLNDSDLNSQLTQFFNSWSELANSPNREGARSLVIQQGRTLAGAIKSLRSDLSKFSGQVDAQLGPATTKANQLFSQIASLNTQISNAEAGTSTANSLRDSRDQIVGQLSQLLDVSVVEQPSGSLNVLVGSTPVVIDGTSRGVRLTTQTVGTTTTVTVNAADDGTQLNVASGTIGGLLKNRVGIANQTITRLDQVASQLIFEVNKLHSQGVGAAKLKDAAGTTKAPGVDQTLALNDPANLTFAGLPYKAVNGGFLVTVTNTQTGASETARIRVDLDGIKNDGTTGTADDTSVISLAAGLNGVANLSASVQPDGTLKISAASGYTVAFGEDTSGALAVLGINTYFTGRDGSDIDVRQELQDNPTLLATGAVVNGQPNDNATALGIAGFRTKGLSVLGDRSITQAWTDATADVGSQTAAAVSRAGAAGTVRQGLDAQRSAISGVDLDEESINLMNYQRQYQGAARFISVVDQLTQTLLAMVGR